MLTSHSSPENAAGGTEVIRATGRIGVHTLAQESQVFHWQKGKTMAQLDQASKNVLTRRQAYKRYLKPLS